MLPVWSSGIVDVVVGPRAAASGIRACVTAGRRTNDSKSRGSVVILFVHFMLDLISFLATCRNFVASVLDDDVGLMTGRATGM